MGKSDKSSVHPLIRQDGRIAKRGIAVVDGITDMPVYGVPYVSSHFIISISHSGMVKAEYDDKKVEFHPHDLSVVYPGHTLLAKSASPDYRATLVVVSDQVFSTLFSSNVSANRFKYEQLPCINLADRQYADVMNAVAALRSTCRLIPKAGVDMALDMLAILVRMVDHFRRQCVDVDSKQGSVRNLSAHFYEAVVKNCARNRDIGFYAEMFSLSPKYFSATIKRETGKSAYYWIKMCTLKQAKQILRTDPEAGINEVAERLGFNDQATFSHFFKKEAGMSPSEYRKKAK